MMRRSSRPGTLRVLQILRSKSADSRPSEFWESDMSVGPDLALTFLSRELIVVRVLLLSFTGVPYPARFDLPTLWSESTFKLSWRVNCSTPIINYQLEFREVI